MAIFKKRKNNKVKKSDKTTKKRFSIFNTNKNEDKDSDIVELDEKGVLEKGQRTIKDFIAPSSIDRSNPDHLVVNNKYVKSYVLNGLPTYSYVGLLSDLYEYNGEMDTALYIEPTDTHIAHSELTDKITEYETQLAIEKSKGSIKNIGKLTNTLQQLYMQRDSLERNHEDLFYVQAYCNLYADDVNDLNRRHTMLMNNLKGKKVSLMPAYRQQDDNYKNVMPYGKVYTGERFRSINTGGVTGLFPFYNSDIIHENGIILGENLSTNMLVMLDAFDRSIVSSGNTTILGRTGSGKSYLVKLMIIRSTFHNIQTVIIDPEKEYSAITKALCGSNIVLSPKSKHTINPFDLEEESETDDFGEPTGRVVVDIQGKIADMLNLIGVMHMDGFTGKQTSACAIILNQLYADFGFTTDPKSLYVTESMWDPNTEIFYHAGDKKPMPTFSDFHDRLQKYANDKQDKDIIDLAESLKMFRRGEVYGMFDCQTSDDIDLANSPVINFDVSELEENILRPIGMYVALTWAWEKFAKKNVEQKKQVIVDEAWQMLKEELPGAEYSADFLEVTSRRIRKRRGNLIVASQSFKEFIQSEKGQAVLTNSPINIFLRQASHDVNSVKNTFLLSQGEVDFLHSAKPGQALIRFEGESAIMKVFSFPHEHTLIDGEKKEK